MITVKVDVDDDPSDEADAYRGAEAGNGISNFIYENLYSLYCTTESYIYSFIHES